MGTRHLLFEAGGLLLAAPADTVKAIHEELPLQPVAATQPWFLGLAVAHGKLLPVTDLGAFAGRRSSSGRTLELAASVGMSGLQVDAVQGFCDSAVVDVALRDHEMLHGEQDNLSLSTRAIVQDDRIHRLLDVAALMQSPVFLSIAEKSH